MSVGYSNYSQPAYGANYSAPAASNNANNIGKSCNCGKTCPNCNPAGNSYPVPPQPPAPPVDTFAPQAGLFSPGTASPGSNVMFLPADQMALLSQFLGTPQVQPTQAAPAQFDPNQPVNLDQLQQAVGGDQRLFNSLSRIAQDPEGKLLLNSALAKGATFGVAPQEMGIAGVTTTFNNGIEILVGDPNDLETLGHELVHAAIGANPDSKREEIVADAIGDRIANRINGDPLKNPMDIIQENLNAIVYRLLPNDNPQFEQNLAALGLQAGI